MSTTRPPAVSATSDVSVIIPVHQRTDYLADAIASILDQAWDGSLEILCVDDGSSTDPFAGLDDRLPANVRLFRKEHEGVGAARQYALERATGRYVAFNDDDDLWLPDKLAKQVEILDRFPELDMVFSDLTVFGEDGSESRTHNSKYPKFEQLGPRRPLDPIALHRFERNALLPMMAEHEIPFFLQSTLVRRDFLNRIGGMDPRAKSCGDCIDFCVRATHGGVIGYLDSPTFLLRRGHTHMTDNPSWYDRELEEFLTIMGNYPDDLQDLLKPLIHRRIVGHGYEHFNDRNLQKARKSYEVARRFGRLNFKQHLKFLICRILGPIDVHFGKRAN